MDTDAEWFGFLEKVYQERGYLVIAYLSEMRIGSVIDTAEFRKLPQPFRLMAPTTLADWEEQAKRAGKPVLNSPTIGWHFYRMVTD